MVKRNLSQVQLTEHKLYEQKYKEFRKLWIKNRSVYEISKRLGLCEGTVKSKNYLGRLQKARGVR